MPQVEKVHAISDTIFLENVMGTYQGPSWEQDNSSTEQFVDTSFETTRPQILRQLLDTF